MIVERTQMKQCIRILRFGFRNCLHRTVSNALASSSSAPSALFYGLVQTLADQGVLASNPQEHSVTVRTMPCIVPFRPLRANSDVQGILLVIMSLSVVFLPCFEFVLEGTVASDWLSRPCGWVVTQGQAMLSRVHRPAAVVL